MKAAIIGCGPAGPRRGGAHSISYLHARAMLHAGTERIRLEAAASRNEANVRDFAAEFPGIRGYRDYREMLEVERPEFVSVCAFPPDREEMVLAALEVGARAVLVEKPFALSIGAAKRMLQAAKSCEARLFVNFQRRFGKPFEWVRKAVGEGRIGRLTGVQVSQPGNKLIDFGPHLIDTALDVVMSVSAEDRPIRVLGAVEWGGGEYQGVPVEAQMAGTVHFASGVRLVIEAGLRQPERLPILRFDGEHGFAELRLTPLTGESGIARGRFRGEGEISICGEDENFHHGPVDSNLYANRAFKEMLHALQMGAPSRLDAAAVLPGLEILLALFESAKQGRMVSLPLETEEAPFGGVFRLPSTK